MPAGLHKAITLPENRRRMKSPEPGLVRSSAAAAGSLIFWGAAGVVFLGTGCVSLDKPAVVKECVATGHCTNEPYVPASDAMDDAAEPEQPDLRSANEPVGAKEDLAPDNAVQPDAGSGNADSLPARRDVAGPEPTAPEDTSDSGADVLADAGSDRARDLGVDLGPDQAVDDADKNDVVKEDVVREDVVREDVVREDVVREDVVREDVVKEDVVREDVVKEDVVKEDVAGPEAPRDTGYGDVPNTACPAVNAVSGGKIVFETTSAVCFVTCDDMEWGWGCSSFSESDRTVKVNGADVKCGGTLPAKKTPGNYYYFQIGAGGNTWDEIHWSGTYSSSCPTPAGGFAP
jgi:hypothetical protein